MGGRPARTGAASHRARPAAAAAESPRQVCYRTASRTARAGPAVADGPMSRQAPWGDPAIALCAHARLLAAALRHGQEFGAQVGVLGEAPAPAGGASDRGGLAHAAHLRAEVMGLQI